MLFSADDRVLLKWWGRRKDTVRKIHRIISQQARFGEAAGACVAGGFMTLTSWSHAWSKSGNISTRCSSMKRSGSGVHVFQLAFEHTKGILNTYFSYVWYLYRRILRQSVRLPHWALYNYCKRWQILIKFGNLFAIRHCIVGAECC